MGMAGGGPEPEARSQPFRRTPGPGAGSRRRNSLSKPARNISPCRRSAAARAVASAPRGQRRQGAVPPVWWGVGPRSRGTWLLWGNPALVIKKSVGWKPRENLRDPLIDDLWIGGEKELLCAPPVCDWTAAWADPVGARRRLESARRGHRTQGAAGGRPEAHHATHHTPSHSHGTSNAVTTKEHNGSAGRREVEVEAKVGMEPGGGSPQHSEVGDRRRWDRGAPPFARPSPHPCVSCGRRGPGRGRGLGPTGTAAAYRPPGPAGPPPLADPRAWRTGGTRGGPAPATVAMPD